jgi:hypothetical protein
VREVEFSYIITQVGVVEMDEQDFRRVEAWLYSIPRIEIALDDLKLTLERLETKRATPPAWLSHPEATPVSGSQVDSRQQRWVEFLDTFDERAEELQGQIRYREQQLQCFNKVMDILRAENSQLAQLVRAKYIDKIKPDSAIYEGVLFVSKTRYYEMRHYAVNVFFECMPGQFPNYSRTIPELNPN